MKPPLRANEGMKYKSEYLDAMRESEDDLQRIFGLLQSALTDDISSREIIMKGIDYSYYYETED